jgi:hypothetical protein
MSAYMVIPCQHYTMGQLLTGMFCADHSCAGETITQMPDTPSVFVDGKVTELESAMALLLHGNPDNGVFPCAVSGHVQAMTEGLANAAREVAGRET